MPPSTTILLKLTENEVEFANTLYDMGMVDKEVVIFFVNDALMSSEASHWNAIISHTPKGTSHHIDTLGNANKICAKTSIKKIKNGFFSYGV